MTRKPSSWIQRAALCPALVAVAACQTSRGNGGGTPATPPGLPSIKPASGPIDEATPEQLQDRVELLNRNSQAVASEWRGKTFDAFEAEVYREPNGGKYIVNGDTPIVDRKHLREFFEQRVQKPPRVTELVVHAPGGVDAVWTDTQKRNLTYCVSTRFGSRHAEMVNAMASAAGAWEAVSDVDFVHASAQDGSCTATNGQVVFDVRPVSGAPYLARAFFPNDARWNRNVLIDDSAFGVSGNLTLTGILRHELGHTLGYRHEHTRPEAGACFEDDDWRPLTTYDAFSVMHYPQCNGGGDWSLTLTAQDQSGAACLYGPAPGFTIDPSICTRPTTEDPPGDCGARTVTRSGQVGWRDEDDLGSFAVTPGSQFIAEMSGTGDPDLYVRFRQPPTRSPRAFDCRPYLTGAIERCALTVPVGAATAHVMIHGFTRGTYNLTIEHTPSR